MYINTLFKTSNAFHHHWLQDYHLKQVMKRIANKFSIRIYKKLSKPLCLKSSMYLRILNFFCFFSVMLEKRAADMVSNQDSQ